MRGFGASSFDAARFRELARARRLALGEPLHSLASTGSTMDVAIDAARAGAPHGAAFVADAQTAGRGRHGRSWWTAPGEALAVSLVLRPRLESALAPPLALVVGLAVRAAVARHLVPRALLKWPNDLLVEGRKLGGILLEAQLEGGSLSSVVVGIGVNLGASEMPAEIAETATSFAQLGAGTRREELLVDVLEVLEAKLTLFERAGVAAFRAEFDLHDALRGLRVRAGAVEGEAAGIDDHGALLVRVDAQLVSVVAGEVQHVRARRPDTWAL